MSSTLPSPSSASTSPPFAAANGAPDIVQMLLEEQQSLTAVERFSRDHENGTTGTPDQAKYYRRLLPATAPGPDQQFAFEVNLDTCSGCKACVVACHTMNGLEESESWRRVGTLVMGDNGWSATDEPSVESESAISTDVPDGDTVTSTVTESALPIVPGIQHVTTACHHCEDPGCLNGCPVKAYDKDPVTGIVRHLDDQCIGCKYCTMMCPYEVPKYSKRLGIVRKCDMCHQRLSKGEAPACVQSCPNEAIAIRVVERTVDAGDGQSPREQATNGMGMPNGQSRYSLVPGAPPSSITRPTTRYVSSRIERVDASMPQDHEVDPVGESHWPLAAMLVATQVGVGVILLERLIALLAWLAGSTLPVDATTYSATVALVISLAGMNVAPLHLGQPLRAWRVFLGLRTSWLSREAVVLGKFVGVLTAAVLLYWLPTLQPHVPEALVQRVPSWMTVPDWAPAAALAAAIVLGIAGLYCSAMIYVATKRTLWRHSRTLPRFFGSGLVAGAAIAGWTIHLGGGANWAVLLLTLLAALAGAIKLVWEQQTLLSRSASFADPLDARSHRIVRRELQALRSGRLITGWVGVGLASVISVLVAADAGLLVTLGLGVASLALLAGESCERLLYFTSVVHDRMPGTLR